MKNFITLLIFILASSISYGQCSSVSISVSSSDTTQVQLYHPGFFNIPSGFANVCDWEVTSFAGDLVFETTTTGDGFEQGLVLFNHSIPITDSMQVNLVITNTIEGITCTITDTLYWEEIEVIPGSFIGNWAILSSNIGVEEPITHITDFLAVPANIRLFPLPAQNYFQITGDNSTYSFTIYDATGQAIATHNNFNIQQKVDISKYVAGVYFIQFRDNNNRNMGVKKIMKM